MVPLNVGAKYRTVDDGYVQDLPYDTLPWEDS